MEELVLTVQRTKREQGLLLCSVDRQNQQIAALKTSVPGRRPLAEKKIRDAIIGDRDKPPSFDGVKKPHFCQVESLRWTRTGVNAVDRAQNPQPYDKFDDEW